MSIDVDGFLSDLARRLRPRAGELVDALIQRIHEELPGAWRYPDTAQLVPVSTSENVMAFLDVLEDGFDTTEIRPPPSALQLARGLAQHGVPITELLRAYRLGHAGTLHFLLEETARRTRDPELIHSVSITIGMMGFEYVDRTSEQVVVTYQEERDRWLQRRLIMVNEASSRIGTTLDIARTAQELTDLGTDRFADLVTVDLLDSVFTEGRTQSANGLLALHRTAQRSASGACPEPGVGVGDTHAYPEESTPARTLATGKPLRYSITTSEAPEWLAATAGLARDGLTTGIHSMLLVPLWARGNPLGLAQFLRYQNSDPFDDDDLLLAQEIASRAAVSIDNACRYTLEHHTALTLQQSLLQQQVPEQAAVESAFRYLPSGSRAGVGGDWYDVIQLSGSRVALVVGDVVGHGLNASATMGRLRTAVRTLADIDLPPDELLTHLDDVVIRLQREEPRATDEISATCLYAVYDPITRVCSLASAGHLPPAVVFPRPPGNGNPASDVVSFPELTIGPPLGLGGLPFETAQLTLPTGSLLALYTDGLIESRERDVDSGLSLLREVLTGAPSSPEAVCDRLLASLLPRDPADDVALLVARTRTLDAHHVATWHLPSDPAMVSKARRYASDQLAAWGLEDLAFTTELMVSELVTNAIRYGQPPIQLRMILQSTLTCEVSDSSNTAPHLRRARVFDEGGRGLLLVAQLAERWGTRHSRKGKVIWAEQSLITANALDLASAQL
ncbi:SpoIIE family protein phosphatase [Streptomyces chartreusis]|uniref:SpoIIE family protein phosphatase n=1 Tax=Streptomyces chartreusis TaxID=1969 RepID=UPI003632D317